MAFKLLNYLEEKIMYIKISIGCILNNSFPFEFLLPKKSKLVGCFEFTSHNGLTQFKQAHCKSPESFFPSLI